MLGTIVPSQHQASNSIKSQHKATENVLVLIREKRNYFPKELEDLASIVCAGRSWGGEAWEQIPKVFDQGGWNIILNKEEFINLRTCS